MHPAFSVIFLTTLIGVGQGLFLALVTGQSYAVIELLPPQESGFYVMGTLLALAFLLAGLGASVFHLGKPSYIYTRAWRAASQWRTSWLSREIIMLPVVMTLVGLYGLLHLLGWDLKLFNVEVDGQMTLLVGTLATIAVFILFLSTGMIYSSIKFLQEWASPLTVINYTLLGSASGFTLAAAYAAFRAPELTNFYIGWAITLTLLGLITRSASLFRNCRLKSQMKSTIQTAIGIRHNQIEQKAMGMMGGSYNTREYFHGRSGPFLRSIKWIFIVMVFFLPILLLVLSYGSGDELLTTAFLLQYIGLLFERWFFFAQANHPQNIYYQTV